MGKNRDRDKGFFDDFSDNIRVVSLCPICNARYAFSDAKTVEEKEGGHLVYIRCRKCGSGVLALIMATSIGVSAVSLVTDLTGQDVMKFKDRNPISIDDVIDFHNHLHNNINIL